MFLIFFLNTFLRTLFFSKLFLIFSFKIDSTGITLDLDPNRTKILDQDPNSIYLDPKHWFKPFDHLLNESDRDLAKSSVSGKKRSESNRKGSGSLALVPVVTHCPLL